LRRKRAELTVSVMLVAIVILFLWEARDWQIRARLGPWTVGFAVLAIALVQVYVAARAVVVAGKAERAGGAPSPGPVVQAASGAVTSSNPPAPSAVFDKEHQKGDPVTDHRKLVFIIGWIVAFCVGLWLVGFRLGAPLLTFGFLRLGAGESARLSCVLALGAFMAITLLFQTVVGLPFPPGWIFQSLGLQSPDLYVVDAVLRLIRANADG
jgi:hypothetical protein